MIYIVVNFLSSHSDGIVQSAIKSLDPDEVVRVGGAGHKVIYDTRTHLFILYRFICA